MLSAKELIKILSKLGYYPIRQRGSHITLSSPTYPQITVPFHKEIRKGTLRAIIREIGIPKERFMELVKD